MPGDINENFEVSDAVEDNAIQLANFFIKTISYSLDSSFLAQSCLFEKNRMKVLDICVSMMNGIMKNKRFPTYLLVYFLLIKKPNNLDDISQ